MRCARCQAAIEPEPASCPACRARIPAPDSQGRGFDAGRFAAVLLAYACGWSIGASARVSPAALLADAPPSPAVASVPRPLAAKPPHPAAAPPALARRPIAAVPAAPARPSPPPVSPKDDLLDEPIRAFLPAPRAPKARLDVRKDGAPRAPAELRDIPIQVWVTDGRDPFPRFWNIWVDRLPGLYHGGGRYSGVPFASEAHRSGDSMHAIARLAPGRHSISFAVAQSGGLAYGSYSGWISVGARTFSLRDLDANRWFSASVEAR